MKIKFANKKFKFKNIVAILASCLLSVFALFIPYSNGLTASADDYDYGYGYSPSLKCYNYEVEMTINTDRTIDVKERITIEFLRNGFSMFYKSLPKDMKYSNIVATCEGNDEFFYYVEENPDYSEFIDVCCEGNADKGKKWTYEITYVAEPSGDDLENGMRLDVVGFGSPFELNDVTVTMNFPEKPVRCDRYVEGVYGSTEKTPVTTGWSDDRKTLVLYEEKLSLVYNDTFGEYTADN